MSHRGSATSHRDQRYSQVRYKCTVHILCLYGDTVHLQGLYSESETNVQYIYCACMAILYICVSIYAWVAHALYTMTIRNNHAHRLKTPYSACFERMIAYGVAGGFCVWLFGLLLLTALFQHEHRWFIPIVLFLV
jgi:hypothetical protein